MSVSSASDYKYIASNSQNSSVALLSPCASKVHLKWIYNLSVTVLLRRRTTEFHVCWLFVWLNTLEKEKMWSFSLFEMTSGCIHVLCFLFSGQYMISASKACNGGVAFCCLPVSNEWNLSSHTLGWMTGIKHLVIFQSISSIIHFVQ